MPATATPTAPAAAAVKQRSTRPRRRSSPDEIALRKKYPHIVPGTLSDVVTDKKSSYFHKRTIKIQCTFPGCKETRVIATSDLAQVRMCEEHVRVSRLERRRDMRAKANGKKKAK